MNQEQERSLMTHLESQEFEDVVRDAAERQRMGTTTTDPHLPDGASEIVACHIADLSFSELEAEGEEGSLVAHGHYTETLKRTSNGTPGYLATRVGIVTGRVKVSAEFPRPAGSSEREGYLSDLTIDLSELEWSRNGGDTVLLLPSECGENEASI